MCRVILYDRRSKVCGVWIGRGQVDDVDVGRRDSGHLGVEAAGHRLLGHQVGQDRGAEGRARFGVADQTC